MKNSLAMVQAIVNRAVRRDKDTEQGLMAIGRRLAALSRTPDVLTRTDPQEAVRDLAGTAGDPAPVRRGTLPDFLDR